jgi:hypothetical protein
VRLFFLTILLLLHACAAPQSADSNVAVVWNRVEEPQRVCESLSGRKNFFRILGCSHWSGPAAEGGPRTCAIYAPEPRHERDYERFATLGHELKHCLDGNWHDRWGRMLPPGENAAAGGSAALHK